MSFAKLWLKTPVLIDFMDNSIIYLFVDFLWASVSTGIAKEDVAFKNVTPTVFRGQ